MMRIAPFRVYHIMLGGTEQEKNGPKIRCLWSEAASRKVGRVRQSRFVPRYMVRAGMPPVAVLSWDVS